MSNPGVKIVNRAQIATLIALVGRGPLQEMDIPSHIARDDLITFGLAVRIIGADRVRLTAATPEGENSYCALLWIENDGDMRRRTTMLRETQTAAQITILGHTS